MFVKFIITCKCAPNETFSFKRGVWGSSPRNFWLLGSQMVHSSDILSHYTPNTHQIYNDLKNGPGSCKKSLKSDFSFKRGVWGSTPRNFWLLGSQMVHPSDILSHYTPNTHQIYTDLKNGPGSCKKKSEIRLKSEIALRAFDGMWVWNYAVFRDKMNSFLKENFHV